MVSDKNEKQHRRIDFFEDFFIETASRAEVGRMCAFHYRSQSRQPYAAAWKISRKPLFHDRSGSVLVGIITYAMPLLNCAPRCQAAGDCFCAGDKKARLMRLNRSVRRISRVVIDPRFRGLGLAGRLVAQTMPLLNIPMIETISAMGAWGHFFERAGMRRIEIPPRPQAQSLSAELTSLGIPPTFWHDAAEVHKRMENLPAPCRRRLEKAFRRFLGAYGRRRKMPGGLERTRFVLSRLNACPAYYVWFNPHYPLREGLVRTG